MRRSLDQFREILPRPAVIAAYAAIYLVASLPLLLAAWRLGAAGGAGVLRVLPTLVHVAGMLSYGSYRARRFHPFFSPDYRRWLETTPWSWSKPLPIGPAHPTWADALVVAAAGLPEWLTGGVPPITSYALALAGYLLPLVGSFAATGAWGFQFPVLFGLGLALGIWRGRPEFSGAAVLATAGIAMIGLRRSFRRWPWADTQSIALTGAPSFVYDLMRGDSVEAESPMLGWPYDHLGPRHYPAPSRRDALGKVLWPLIAGWLIYMVERAIEPVGQLSMRLLLVGNLTISLAAFRLMTTLRGYSPPFSLIGRIARFRPLIPDYDRVFLAPIAGPVVALVGPWVLSLGGLSLDVGVAACASLGLLVLTLGGPDRQAWQLTGRHRVVPGIIVSGGKTKGAYVQTG